MKENIKNRYQFLDTLGEGTFGKVKVACLISNPSKKYAIKSIPRDMVDQVGKNKLMSVMD